MKLAAAFILVALLSFFAGWIGAPALGADPPAQPVTHAAHNVDASTNTNANASASASASTNTNTPVTSGRVSTGAPLATGTSSSSSTIASPDGGPARPALRPISSLSASECAAELESTRAVVADFERKKAELEGEPIAPKAPSAPRFGESGLVQTFNAAFAASKIEGRVESVDCTEFPCVVFGRLQGDEESVAKLENTAPFQAYDADVGVMLTWAEGHHEHGEADPKEGREKPAEVSLFAFAFYTDADRDQHGDHLNRRIRVRTAEYWNASSHAE